MEEVMEQWNGKSVLSGIAIGKIRLYTKKQQLVKQIRIENVTKEIARYESARQCAVEELHQLFEKACIEVGEAEAQLFDIHAMMLEDSDYTDTVTDFIKSQHMNAEFAVARTGDYFAKMFSDMDDAYFRERAADIQDITERLISILQGESMALSIGSEPVIVVAKELAPSETIQMDKSKLLGFVTEVGSVNSHTAILARTMNIPALLRVKMKTEWNEKLAIIDGEQGKFIVDPTEEVLEEYRCKQQERIEKEKIFQTFRGKPNTTLSGKQIGLYANIGNVKDLESVMFNEASGIGLFRSEFLYFEKQNYPTEEEQFEAYKLVAETMGEKQVIIRTLDGGADKQADYFHLEQEENPAMGFRGIRISLERSEIFKTQLRAIYRASRYGTIAIMYPMIHSITEVRKIKEIVAEVQQQLVDEGIAFHEIKQGIMIETPAAAIISDILAKEVDFFSIGTNDLTQYTLAIDRQNSKLEQLYDTHHEAVLRLIQLVIENGHNAGIPVGLCGEMAADETMTSRLIGMGIDSLSVVPSHILPIRKAIRETE